MNKSYLPSYTWPNPAFPFRIYLDHPNLRIFIIENIHHNWKWFQEYSKRFQKRDYFFVYCGWFHSQNFLKEDIEVFDQLNLNKDKFYFLFNSSKEFEIYRTAGFLGNVINHNAWIDENGVMYPETHIKKIYDAVYIARHSPFKRHELATKVNNLALVMGNDHKNKSNLPLPNFLFKNDSVLAPEEVRRKINQSFCGLILSDTEGACFSSSEYLLCGVPVVSTYSNGGRDEWYTSHNSIVCEADPNKIAEAVDFFKKNLRDPFKIRDDHIKLSNIYRERFVNILEELFYRNSVDINAKIYFKESYIHKMRKSCVPDFENIWA
jgi:glycosyltransferase involved in cell wall biosynthesis